MAESVASFVTIVNGTWCGRTAWSMPEWSDMTKSAALAPPFGETTVEKFGRRASFSRPRGRSAPGRRNTRAKVQRVSL